ncbi:LysE family translocator [Vibrio metoecus]|uniref:LysE family translocator n=1 Tax=Vibrio metoecus TaxID=1481663 RepID=UPI000BA8E4CB|nr:LysE family translocator [Vibrio metoecus]PAR27165.1 threonine transporter [Vibrio metoecus]PAR61014.1 threonine transporter [Vibrio metoecus]
MNEMSILATLAGVHFIALLSPGPDVALVVQNATQHGRKTGVMIALGLSCGILVHLILSLTGISYLVKQQPLLFNLLQLAGGSYLLYLGVGALQSVLARKSSTPVTNSSVAQLNSHRQAFTKGIMTNLLNPKALVFFVSLLSSLIPASMSVSGKVSAAVILVGLSLTWFSCLAWLLTTSAMQQRMQRITRSIDSLCALVFILAGGVILWQASRAIMQALG